jgi:hypothetical protein
LVPLEKVENLMTAAADLESWGQKFAHLKTRHGMQSPVKTVDKKIMKNTRDIYDNSTNPMPVGNLANLGIPNFGGNDCAINSWMQGFVSNREYQNFFSRDRVGRIFRNFSIADEVAREVALVMDLDVNGEVTGSAGNLSKTFNMD